MTGRHVVHLGFMPLGHVAMLRHVAGMRLAALARMTLVRVLGLARVMLSLLAAALLVPVATFGHHFVSF
jgi:hypothetical protein